MSTLPYYNIKLSDVHKFYLGDVPNALYPGNYKLSEYQAGGRYFSQVSRGICLVDFTLDTGQVCKFNQVVRASNGGNIAYAAGIRSGQAVVLRFNIQTGQEEWVRVIAGAVTDVVGLSIISNTTYSDRFDCLVTVNTASGGRVTRVSWEGAVTWQRQFTQTLTSAGRWSGENTTSESYGEFRWAAANQVQYYTSGNTLFQYANDTQNWARTLTGGSGNILSISVCKLTGRVYLLKQGSTSSSLVVQCVGADGTHQWCRQISLISGTSIVPASISVAPTGTGVTALFNTSSRNTLGIVTLSSAGDLRMARTVVPTGYTARGVSISTDTQGGHLIVGDIINTSYPDNTLGLLMRLDSNGQQLWSREASFPYGSGSGGFKTYFMDVLDYDGERLLVSGQFGTTSDGLHGAVVSLYNSHIANDDATLFSSYPALDFNKINMLGSAKQLEVAALGVNLATVSASSSASGLTSATSTGSSAVPINYALNKSSDTLAQYSHMWPNGRVGAPTDIALSDFRNGDHRSYWLSTTPSSAGYRFLFRKTLTDDYNNDYNQSYLMLNTVINTSNFTTAETQLRRVIRTDGSLSTDVVYAINSSVANPVFTDMARCPVDSGIFLVGYEGDSGIVVKVNGSNYLTSWRKSLSKSGEYARFLCVAATQDHRSPSTVSNVIYVGGHKGEDIPIVAAYYDRAGPSFGLLWQRQLNGLTGIVERIAVDPQDNSVYALVTDQTVGADTWYYVVKLDHLGNQIWCTGVKKTATTGLAVEMAVDYDNIRLLVFDTVFSIKKTDGVLSGEWARSIYIRTITSSPQSAYTSILPVDVTVCQDGHLAVLYMAMHPTTGQWCGIITKLKNGLLRTTMAIDNFNPQTITELKNGQLCVCGYSSQLGKSITCTLPMASTTASFTTALSWGVSTVTTLSAVSPYYSGSNVMGIYLTVTAVNLGYTDAEIYTVSTTGASINTTKTFLDQF